MPKFSRAHLAFASSCTPRHRRLHYRQYHRPRGSLSPVWRAPCKVRGGCPPECWLFGRDCSIPALSPPSSAPSRPRAHHFAPKTPSVMRRAASGRHQRPPCTSRPPTAGRLGALRGQLGLGAPARLGCLRRGRQGAAVGRVLSRVYVRMQPHKHRTAAREGGAARARGETSGQRRQMRARAPPLPPASRYWHTRRRAWRRASSRWSHVGGTRTCGTVWWPCRALPPAALLQTCWDGSRGDVTGAVGHTAPRARARLPPLPFCCVGDRGER